MNSDREPLEQDPPVVRIAGPDELVAAAPYLVGFTPQQSVVAVSLRGPRLRCGLVARADLPPGPEDAEPFARDLVDQVARDRPEQVALLVYADAAWHPEQRPWQRLVDCLELELASSSIGLKEAVYVGGQRFWSYSCHEPRCCPDEGTPLEPARTGAVAAALVASGRAPFADRESLERQVAPLDRRLTKRVGRLARERRAQMRAGDPRLVSGPVERLFGDLVLRRAAGADAPPTVREAATLVAGLTDVAVRDAVAMRWSAWLRDTGPGPTGQDAAVTALLRDLATMTDGEWSVSPLTLYALQCWQVGEGTLATVAIQRALALDSEYRMARLVEGLLRAGVLPRAS